MEIFIGGISQAFSKTITSPFEVIKMRLQLNKEGYNGFSDCLVKMVREEGFHSLWKGNLLNIIRYFPTQYLNFKTKGVIEELFFPKPFSEYSPKQQMWRKLLSGGVVGSFSLIFVYPLDLLRTRISKKKIY
jgi:solute carrier family 25 (mitochondrial adenine nucleotide translocator), member 4/5/6/31